MKELIALAADKSIQLTIAEIIRRPNALGIHALAAGSWDTLIHPTYDSGIVRTSHELLRSQSRLYRYALVICDLHGAGTIQARTDVELRIERRLSECGWENRCSAVVIDPELEQWVWTDSPHVADVLGWHGRTPVLRGWLEAEGYWDPGRIKPATPQRALDAALRRVQKRRSSAIFQELARRVSFTTCIDPAFLKLKNTLQQWFPSDVPGPEDRA